MAGQFAVVLDGISLQLAGELLLDSAVSRPYRNRCQTVYRSALEDYAFASLLGQVVTVSGNLPDVKGEKPGETLASLNERIQAIEQGRELPDVSELIGRQHFRKAVEEDLVLLDRSFEISSESWCQFFVREADVYLGDDDSLRAARIDPKNYRYARSVRGVLREKYYLHEKDLQDKIPDKFQSSVLSVLRQRTDRSAACDGALREFIQRVAVTHTALYWWYEQMGGEHIALGGARLPFATRTTLRLADRDRYMETVGELRDVLFPHALQDALGAAGNDREKLRRQLVNMWDDAPYPYIRLRLKKLFPALAQGDASGAWQLAKEIRTFEREARRPFVIDDVTLEAKLDSKGPSAGMKAPGSVFQRVLAPRRTILREWVARTPAPQYQAMLENVFPELRRSEWRAG